MGVDWIFEVPFVGREREVALSLIDEGGMPLLIPSVDVALVDLEVDVGIDTGWRTCDGCTSTGNQPPGACFTFADSIPRRRGMEGPVRSMSRIPTEQPARERDRAS